MSALVVRSAGVAKVSSGRFSGGAEAVRHRTPAIFVKRSTPSRYSRQMLEVSIAPAGALFMRLLSRSRKASADGPAVTNTRPGFVHNWPITWITEAWRLVAKDSPDS